LWVVSRQKEALTTRYQFRDVIEVNGKEMFKGDGSQEPPMAPWELSNTTNQSFQLKAISETSKPSKPGSLYAD
jgi:hypothetical protein